MLIQAEPSTMSGTSPAGNRRSTSGGSRRQWINETWRQVCSAIGRLIRCSAMSPATEGFFLGQRL
jgi:hypothetical protein